MDREKVRSVLDKIFPQKKTFIGLCLAIIPMTLAAPFGFFYGAIALGFRAGIELFEYQSGERVEVRKETEV